MTVHARPEPKDAPQLAPPTTHELLVMTQRRDELDRRLGALLERWCRPAQLRGPFRLSSTKTTVTDEAGAPCASIGFLNPNPVSLYTGIGGAPARPGQGAIIVPPNALMVLPVEAEDVELGVDATDPLLTEEAVIHVLRFETVQAAFLGAV